MFSPDHNASPVNSVPPVIVLIAAAIALIELGFQLGASGLVGGSDAVGWRIEAIQAFAFSDPLFDWMRQNRQLPADGLWRFVTFPFVHSGAMHAIFACVMILAIGKFVAERFATISVVVIMLVASIVGAAMFSLFIDTRQPLIGAYPGVYGLLGGFTFTLLVYYDAAGENRLKAFQLIALLMGLQLVFGMIDGVQSFEWIADLTGFVVGFILSVALAPGGLARLRSMRDSARKRN